MKELVLFAVFTGNSLAQTGSPMALIVDVESAMQYRSDIANPAKRGSDPGSSTPADSRAFTDVPFIGDIVAVNGKPAKGLWSSRQYLMNSSPTPAAGLAVADVGRATIADCKRELLGGAPAVLLWAAWAAGRPAAQPKTPPVPVGLVPVVWPKDNPYTPEKAELGRLLYFDPRLSADGTVSCASCHNPKFAFTDGAAVSTGIKGQKGGRSAPTVINRAYTLAQFWDGRAATLEEQAKGPMANPIEMGNTHDAVVSTVRRVPGYRKMFAKVFGTEDFTIEHVAMAIATFERTVLSGNSAYDRYQAGDKTAMTPAQVRGMAVFFNKAKCDQCHEGINFTVNMYANLGVGTDRPNPDEGRYAVTKDPRDWGAFKTPTLRDISRTAPYMHDGSLKTLEEVVDLYDKGGIPNKNLDAKIKPLHLSDQEKKDLVAFLHALDGQGWQKITAPEKFPD